MKFIISKLIIYLIFNLLDIFSPEDMDVAANEQVSTLLSQSIQTGASLSRDTPRKKKLRSSLKTKREKINKLQNKLQTMRHVASKQICY